MRLSLITDEVSQNPQEAAEFAVDHGVHQVAIRSMWGRNIMQCTDRDLERLASVLGRYELTVSSILSPLFKCPPEARDQEDLKDPHFVGFPPSYERHLAEAKRLPVIAEQLGAPTVRIFTFTYAGIVGPQPPHCRTVIVDTVGSWRGVNVGVENEFVCYVRTLSELQEFCESSELAAVVDPCNEHVAKGGDGLSGLTDRLIARAVDVHVKDRFNGAYVPVGSGTLAWPAIIERLAGEEYAGPVTLESHLRGDRAGIAASIRALRGWGVA
ncbi:sugar phosphate isomerase/epimerase [Streptomyces sp. TP-A0356]|uniref:sugar phosphate isomerase/epimerase family protein n=1 Tax=Streptomyces sp. TP-A0356 TaxID=1359208 RepID=UPI0006E269CC|nr:TIM barrel protein [Streptomyces sp. TP-A0356]